MRQAANLPWEELNRLIEGYWRNRPNIEEKVEADDVLEYWVQQYVSSNPDQFGLKELAGPFKQGPDFKAKVRGYHGNVDIEVEVLSQNYIKHGHPEDRRWDNVKVLIVLEEKEPDEDMRKKLPKKILHVNKKHFEGWYREADRQYALKKEPVNAVNRAAAKVGVIAGRVHLNWLEVCPHKQRDMATCPDCNYCPYFGQGCMDGEASEVFEEIALRFLQERNTPAQLNLGDIPAAEVDAFCQKVFYGE
jgi:hypothetical protein